MESLETETHKQPLLEQILTGIRDELRAIRLSIIEKRNV